MPGTPGVVTGGELGARLGVGTGSQFRERADLSAEQVLWTVDDPDPLVGEGGGELLAPPGLLAGIPQLLRDVRELLGALGRGGLQRDHRSLVLGELGDDHSLPEIQHPLAQCDRSHRPTGQPTITARPAGAPHAQTPSAAHRPTTSAGDQQSTTSVGKRS
jgi:hypothetical protein